MTVSKPLRERFENKYTACPMSGCWLWMDAPHPDFGYGCINVPGRGVIKAHRVAWELFVGPIPEGLFVCHHCDTPPCVNPAHLFLGTHQDNMRDMHAKGRWRGRLLLWTEDESFRNRFPDGYPGSTLTADQVVLIKRRISAGDFQKDIARDFNIDPSSVSNIKTRRYWSWL